MKVTSHTLLCHPGGAAYSTVCAVDDDVSKCASSAANGYKVWSSLTCQQRAKVLLRYYKLTEAPVKILNSVSLSNRQPEMEMSVHVLLPTDW